MRSKPESCVGERDADGCGFWSCQSPIETECHCVAAERSIKSSNMLARNDYIAVESQFLVAFKICSPVLSEDSIAHARHYLDHGELEMSYESLCLACGKRRFRCRKKPGRYSLTWGQGSGSIRRAFLGRVFGRSSLLS